MLERQSAENIETNPNVDNGRYRQIYSRTYSRLTHSLIHWLTDWLIDWLIEWVTDSLTRWLTPWFSHPLARSLVHSFQSFSIEMPWWRHEKEALSALLALFVLGIHRWPVNSPHKGQWRGAVMFSLIYAWTNNWVNNRDVCGFRHHRAHYDVNEMFAWHPLHHKSASDRAMVWRWSD